MVNDINSIKSIIYCYNDRTGAGLRTNVEANQQMVDECLTRVGGDPTVVRNHIRRWVQEHKCEGDFVNRLEECLDAIPIPSNVVSAPREVQMSASLKVIEDAVATIVAQNQSERIWSEISSKLDQQVKDFIKNEYGTITRKVDTIINGEHVDLDGVQHEKFETVLKFVANNEPVMLVGPAGSGKNELCKQVAKALNLDFYFTNAVTQEYKITGFTDANGRYQETQFYKAFKNGGLFMLDEMDASIPEVLVILNAAVANGYFDFPAPIGFVEAHPNFRVIAAGNTLGHGADYEYVGRNQLDGASLDRFAVVPIEYSKTIETAMANGDTELVTFCREYREAARKAGLKIIVSYRAIKRLAKMVNLLPLREALETCLLKGLERDDINMVWKGLRTPSKYARELESMRSTY